MEDGNRPHSPSKAVSSNGLKQAVLSPNETLAQSIALIAPTVAPLLAVPLVFASAGAGTWLAFLISTVTIVLVAFNVNQFARMSASPGSLYSYIAAHMHPALGMVAGWALLLAYIGTAMALCAGLTNYVNVILKSLLGLQVSPLLVSAVGIGLAGWLAYCDVKVSVRLMLGFEGASMGLITIVAFAILIRNGFHVDLGQLRLEGVTAEKLRMGLVLAIFCLVGFESATSLGSEAKDPLRSIPRAVTWSAVLTGLFFIFCAYTEVLGFRGESVSLDKSVAPLHLLAKKAGLPLFGELIDFGAAVSFFSCVLACLTAAARVLFLMGRHGTLHSQLGEAHGSKQTPHRAVLLSAVATFLPLGMLMLRGVDGLDIYGLMGTFGTFGFLTVYILICIAAPIYLRMRGRLTVQDIVGSTLAIVALGVAVFGSLYPVPPAPYSSLPYIYAGCLMTGMAWSLVWNARSPVQRAQIRNELKALAD